jgi:hypothetical protein
MARWSFSESLFRVVIVSLILVDVDLPVTILADVAALAASVVEGKAE